MGDIKLNVNGVEFVVTEEEYTKASEEGSLNLTTEDYIVKSKDDFETLSTNLKKEGYNDGKIAGEEMSVKAAREQYGLEFEGKTFDKFAEALKSKIETDAKIEPNAKVKELTQDKETLQKRITDIESEFGAFKTQVSTEREMAKIDGLIYKEIPSDNLSISRDDVALIFKNKYTAKKTDDGIEWQKDGITVKDTNMNPKGIKDIMDDFIKPYAKTPTGGTGSGDDTGGKQGDYESFVSEMEKKGVKPGSLEFQKEMNKRIGDKTLTV